MTVVIDASLALKWVLQEEHTEDALALWDYWQETEEQVIAPPVFSSEVSNTLHQRLRRGHLSRSEASEALDSLMSVLATSEPEGLYSIALALADRLILGTTYDALYLALAEFEGCEMWTADRRLATSVRARFPRVRWLGERP